ncbi:ATP-binding protein [Micromonospora phaseoli]|uniref:ATP-binding protein n=1 Tax=Micromonospora phaseoli TaxID=1144548 RepID=UPI0018E0769E|nr:ATP-binding protein [Micromonospora phaseoli]
MPAGLILLVGPPAAGKSTFARAWVERGRIDADGVVSCDSIRNELFGARVDVGDDPAVFGEMDLRVAARLAAALAVVVDATNVMPPARARMIAWARQHGRPVTVLRFRVVDEVLVRRNAGRTGDARVPTDDVLRYAAVAAQHTADAQLFDEGTDVVIDVPGEAEGVSPAEAAAIIRLDV